MKLDWKQVQEILARSRRAPLAPDERLVARVMAQVRDRARPRVGIWEWAVRWWRLAPVMAGVLIAGGWWWMHQSAREADLAWSGYVEQVALESEASLWGEGNGE